MLRSVAQDDFSAGIWQGERGPANAVYDATNMLIDDDGFLVTRGATTRQGAALTAGTLVGHTVGYTAAGFRTLSWDNLSVLREHGSGTAYSVYTAKQIQHYGRAATVGGFMALPTTTWNSPAVVYAGSRKAAGYTTGTVAVTNGSTTVTGTGTSWLANADAGMLFQASDYGVVRSVSSDTSLTLMKPYTGPTTSGIPYSLNPTREIGPGSTFPSEASTPVVGVAVRRLLIASQDRMYYSAPDDPFDIGGLTNYHELPGGHATVAVQGVGNAAYWFTTGGTFLVDNLDLDPLDDFGNVQHTVRQVDDVPVYSKGEPGVVGWNDGVIVPGRSDILWVTRGQAPVAINTGWRQTWQDYVAAGWRIGNAAIYNNHLFLPLMSTTTSSPDVWVCRLDRGFAWTRWGNGGSRTPRALAASDTALTAADTQYAVSATAVINDAGSNTLSDTGSAFTATVTSREFKGHQYHSSFWKRLRVRARTDVAPTVLWANSVTGTLLPAASLKTDSANQRFAFQVEQTEPRLVVKLSTGAVTRLYHLELLARPTGRL